MISLEHYVILIGHCTWKHASQSLYLKIMKTVLAFSFFLFLKEADC